VAFAASFYAAVLGEGVHDGGAHTVETARLDVCAAVELAARVQGGHDHFEGGNLQFRMRAGGDAASVVAYCYRAVFADSNIDAVAVALHGFVNRVVYNFVNEVMKAVYVGASDVHTGALADGFETFEHLD
jgi:hypothetical protein